MQKIFSRNKKPRIRLGVCVGAGAFLIALTVGCGKSGETGNSAPPIAAPPVSGAPDGAQPADFTHRGPQDVLIQHDKSAGGWLAPAAEAFNQTQRKGKVFLTPVGSREGRDSLLYAKNATQPELWIPGDRY